MCKNDNFALRCEYVVNGDLPGYQIRLIIWHINWLLQDVQHEDNVMTILA